MLMLISFEMFRKHNLRNPIIYHLLVLVVVIDLMVAVLELPDNL